MTTAQIILTLILSIIWAIAIHAILRVIRSYRAKKKSLTYREMSDLLKFHRDKAIELDKKLKDIDSNTPYSSRHTNIYNGSLDEFLEHRRKQSVYEILKAQDPSRPDRHNDLLSPSIQEKIIPIEIKSASIDHVSIGINGIGLGLSNIEYKFHAQDSVEMLKRFLSDDLKNSSDIGEQSNIESNTSDTCSDNSSIDFGGGDSGGSGSGNDY